jgi:GNAT superfamily N-acetyltransferase/ssRNA-specific RNase YbeY (16S rRNA maturation enzyme)
MEDSGPGRIPVYSFRLFARRIVSLIYPTRVQEQIESIKLRLLSSLFRTARRLLPISELNLVLRKDLETLLIPYQPRIPLEISIASERDVEDAARLRDFDSRLIAVYKSRWRRGHKCFVAKAGDTVIASNWLTLRAEVDNADFTAVRDGEVVCSDAYTAPSWRGNGIHTALLSRMLHWARDAGYRVAYTEVSAWGRDSWITHYRLGWEIVQIAIWFLLGRGKRETVWVFGRSSHPLRWRTGARQLVLRRFTDRLPTSVPWLCSRFSVRARTDIFIVDPAWGTELSQMATLIHSAVTSGLARGLRAARSSKRLQVTVLLGDNVMNLQLQHRACGVATDVAMLCFAEVPAVFSLRGSDTVCLGCIALAREALSREAENARIPLSRHLASVVTEASLALLGHVDGKIHAQRPSPAQAFTRYPNPLFHAQWYLTRYPDVRQSSFDPYEHFVRYGVSEGRNPNPVFNTFWYLANNPDVRASGMNPLDHYLRYGAAEGRKPGPAWDFPSDINPFFDSQWYLETYADIRESSLHPYEHFVRYGASEGRNPNAFFDTSWYFANNPDVCSSGMNPLDHYLRYGAAEGRAPGPSSDSPWRSERVAGYVANYLRRASALISRMTAKAL